MGWAEIVVVDFVRDHVPRRVEDAVADGDECTLVAASA
jgi:hypothetical protein